MDKMDLIRKGLEDLGPDPIDASIEVRSACKEDIEWLIAEVERLRWIEDAAVWYVQYGGNGHIDNLHRVVKANPRPESGT